MVALSLEDPRWSSHTHNNCLFDLETTDFCSLPFLPTRVMLVWQGGRSLLIHTEVGELTVEELSLVKISQRSTALLPTPLAGWLSLWSKPNCVGEFWFRWVHGFIHSPRQTCTRDKNLKQWPVGEASICAAKFLFVKIVCLCVTGVLCYWSAPASIHLLVHLRFLRENWVRAAANCQQELWSTARSDCQVTHDLQPL